MRAFFFSPVLVLSMLLALPTHAAAPVVDDSDNFAVFDDEGGAPSSHPGHQTAIPEEQQPLAREMPADKSQSLSLPDQVRALQQDVQSLRGELEVQAHAIEALKQQGLANPAVAAPKTATPSMQSVTTVPAPASKDMGQTPDTARPATAQPTTFDQTPSPKNPADEQIAYLAAYDLVKAKRYNDALTAMENFIKQYPRSGYAANAEYWTGELYLARNLPAQALQHFETVLTQFPTSSKAAASALKVGYALAAMGHRDEAKARLKEVIKNYPDTSAAHLAKTKLKSL